MSSPASQMSGSPREQSPAAQSPPIDAALSAATALGIASNAFPTYDAHGVTPLSLPPEGFFNSYTSLKEAACRHAKLARYALIEGKGSKKVGGKAVRFLQCVKHSEYKGKGAPKEGERQRFSRSSKKTDCQVKLKINERPDNRWELRYMEDRQQHNYPAGETSEYYQNRRLTAT